MIFSEIYSAYYKTIAEILKAALSGKQTSGDLRKIVEKYAFSESMLTIEPALKSEKWPLIKSDGVSVIKNPPSMPLTSLQKSWLKAVSLDPRIKLFDVSFDLPEDIPPLFTPDDYYIFDKYSDGDDFEDENYIKNFRRVLDAVKERKKLFIKYRGNKGNDIRLTVFPEYVEYSEKDDKFRLAANTHTNITFVNIGSIIYCEETDRPESEIIFNEIPEKYISAMANIRLIGIEHAITNVGLISLRKTSRINIANTAPSRRFLRTESTIRLI